jgi:hypothetical protein
MAAGTESQVLAVELERVMEDVPLLYERDDVFYAQVEKRPAEIVSSIAMRIPLELRPGGKAGMWSSDGGDMGRGDMPTYDKAEVNTTELIYRMEWTSRRKYGVDSNRKAVVNTFRRDLANGMKEFRRFSDTLCMTAGNAVIGTITTVTTVGGIDTYTFTTDGFGVRLMRFDQEIDIWNASLTTKRTGNGVGNSGSYPILYYDGPNKTIQITSPGSVAGDTQPQPGDLVIVQGNTTSPPSSILGVPYHNNNSSTGSWLGFNRATTPEVRANGTNVGGGLSLPPARLAINKIGDRLGILKRNMKLFWWTHPCQSQAYEELGQLVSIINKEDKNEGLDLYFSNNMRLAGAPLKESFNWDKTRMDAIDMEHYGRAEFYPTRFFKDENGLKFFVVRGASGGVAASNLTMIVANWQLFTDCPPAISYLYGLSVPPGY